VPEGEMEILPPADAQAALPALRSRSLYLIAALGLATGMCRNELLALHWQDVDLDAASLTVNLSLEYIRKHGLRFKAPKTKRGRRTITLPSHITHPGFCGSKDGSSRVPCPTIGVGTL